MMEPDLLILNINNLLKVFGNNMITIKGAYQQCVKCANKKAIFSWEGNCFYLNNKTILLQQLFPTG